MVTFFFVKQKTAYEVRISDWSSDVCSSDLAGWWSRSAPAQQLAQRGGVSAAHAQVHRPARRTHPDRAATALHAHLADVGQRNKQRAVDPDEPGRDPLLLQDREGRADPVRVALGVQAGIVALRHTVVDGGPGQGTASGWERGGG